jgi:glycosyltransferase involved in cell wall biosynthesis
MKIALLGSNLRVSGGASRGRSIVDTLPRVAPMHEYLMIVPEGWRYVPERAGATISVLECPRMPLWKRALWERRVLYPALEAYEPDWVWALGNHGLRTGRWRQSLLISDAHYVGYSWKHLGYHVSDLFGVYPLLHVKKWSIRRSARFSRRVYLQTETMRERFARHFGYPPERLGLCPNSFSPRLARSTEWPEKLDSCRGRFILFILAGYGADFKHKNLERVLRVFSEYRRELKDVVCVLPLAEGQNGPAAALIRRIKKLGIERLLPCVGTIPQCELGSYYHAADVLFLPTTLESFSSTYVEAMYFDTPILTSDLDFAHEICGDAADYVDPFSIESIKDGILRLKNDPSHRQELAARGRTRLATTIKNWPTILCDVLDQEGIEHLEPVPELP